MFLFLLSLASIDTSYHYSAQAIYNLQKKGRSTESENNKT